MKYTDSLMRRHRWNHFKDWFHHWRPVKLFRRWLHHDLMGADETNRMLRDRLEVTRGRLRLAVLEADRLNLRVAALEKERSEACWRPDGSILISVRPDRHGFGRWGEKLQMTVSVVPESLWFDFQEAEGTRWGFQSQGNYCADVGRVVGEKAVLALREWFDKKGVR